MSSVDFTCPLPTALTAIPEQDCPQKTGQIQRIAFRRTQDPAAATPTFATMADIVDLSKWTAAMAATDRMKIVISPFTHSFVIPPGTPITEEGNNNNTVNGVAILEGYNNVDVTARLLNLPGTIADAIRALTPHSALTPGFTGLEAVFFNEFGRIILKTDGATTPKPMWFPIYNFVLPSRGSEGLNKPDVHNIMFTMLGDWDEHYTISDPGKATTPWNPLYDL